MVAENRHAVLINRVLTGSLMAVCAMMTAVAGTVIVRNG